MSMRELMPCLCGDASGRVFGITFDEGFRSVQRHAMPVLAEFGFSATNYVVSGQITGSKVWVSSGVPALALDESRGTA